MISIIEHIEFLMTSNDCVVIPGWGALIAQHENAIINAEAHRISKPRRCISFNASVSHNDGLLAQSMVKREGVSYDEAMKEIAANVQMLRQIAASGVEIPFGSLGYFNLNDEGNIEFIPFFRNNCNDAYFGLKSRLDIKTITEQEADVAATARLQQAETGSHDTPSLSTPQTSLFRNYMRIAASFIVLIALYCTLSTPIAVDMTRQSMASISVPEIKKQPKQNIKVITKPKTTEKAELEPEVSSDENSGKYFLIISTFKTEAQAKTFVSAHADLNAKIRKKGNTYRIYIDRSDDYCKLSKKIGNLPSEYKEAWISD